jgi:outer membrane protein assembly factor BamB
MPVNLTGDDHYDIFVCSLGDGPHTAHTLAIDGLTGDVLWTKEFGTYAGFMGIMDYDEDGLDDMIMREHFDFFILLGPTGTEKKGPFICGYHTPIIQDLDGDNTTEVVWGAGWGSLTVDRKRTVPGFRDRPTYRYVSHIWTQLFGGGDSNEVYTKMPTIGDVDGDGVMEIGAGNLNGTLHCFGGSKGKLEWDYIIGANPSDIISCDIDGDGRDEFIFGTSDGRLISLGNQGVEWSMDFGDRVGTPIICDLDRDSKADILVPAMDGNVYALHIAESPYPLVILALAIGAIILLSRASIVPDRSKEHISSVPAHMITGD